MKTLDITSSDGPVWHATPNRDAVWAGRPLHDYCAEAIEIAGRESVELVFPFNTSTVTVKKDSIVDELVATYMAEEAVVIEKWCRSPGGRKVMLEDVVNYVVDAVESSGVRHTQDSVRAAFMQAIPEADVRYIKFTQEEVNEGCEMILDKQEEIVSREVAREKVIP
jgi:hypothetical protein